MFILLAIACLMGVAAGAPNDLGYAYDSISVPRYNFHYSVNDPHTGDNKAQSESREGGVVKGSYSLKEPDGTLRVVDYKADSVSGFNAVVKRIGTAVHPQKIIAAPVKFGLDFGYGGYDKAGLGLRLGYGGYDKAGLGLGQGYGGYDKAGLGFGLGSGGYDKVGLGLGLGYSSYAKSGLGLGYGGYDKGGVGIGLGYGGYDKADLGLGYGSYAKADLGLGLGYGSYAKAGLGFGGYGSAWSLPQPLYDSKY